MFLPKKDKELGRAYAWCALVPQHFTATPNTWSKANYVREHTAAVVGTSYTRSMSGGVHYSHCCRILNVLLLPGAETRAKNRADAKLSTAIRIRMARTIAACFGGSRWEGKRKRISRRSAVGVIAEPKAS